MTSGVISFRAGLDCLSPSGFPQPRRSCFMRDKWFQAIRQTGAVLSLLHPLAFCQTAPDIAIHIFLKPLFANVQGGLPSRRS